MTVALSDIVLLRNLLRMLPNLNNASLLCENLQSFYTMRKVSLSVIRILLNNKSINKDQLNQYLMHMQPVAATINTLAGALYRVFSSSPDPARTEMRQACFDYLSLGGIHANGPISLLSGLNPRPMSLVLHFFAVASYGIGRLVLPFPSPTRMWAAARLISVSNQPSKSLLQCI